jgi:inorganic pyrophosphatase
MMSKAGTEKKAAQTKAGPGKSDKTEGGSLEDLNAVDGRGVFNVIIDTPRGSRNKLKYDPALKVFKLGGVLPAGMSFPFHFGFIPSTLGGDGDPLDVLVLMDEPAFPGCLIETRLIGVIEAEQTKEGKTERNDRLIAVATESRTHQDMHSLADLNPRLLDEIEHFFISYNEVKGKDFRPLARSDSDRASEIVREGMRSHRASRRKK